MKEKRLKLDFFNRATLAVARELLGKHLVRRQGSTIRRFVITEVEAYVGQRDLASHASKRRSARNEVMFGPPGYLYVYFVYGMHWMLNIVTERREYPAAVLIRGVEGLTGPARLTKALSITGKFNGLKAEPKSGLWFEDAGFKVTRSMIQRTPRIGVDYAGEVWKNKLYRFVLKRGFASLAKPL